MKKAKAARRKTRRAVPQKPAERARALPLHIEPLPATFSLIGMLGFIITTVFTVSGRVPLSWGVAFDIVFALMFIASMISITPKFAGWD
ncbi:hypothetical protein HYU20_02895 [Candidatus Woesearchaeota archaeon]|nr:hypothetical protein [Candidatus Woesearchaeota archaeon]